MFCKASGMCHAFSLMASFVLESVETELCFGLCLFMLCVNASQGKKCIACHTEVFLTEKSLLSLLEKAFPFFVGVKVSLVIH